MKCHILMANGQVLRVSGRSRFANENNLPDVLRVKHSIPSFHPAS